MKACRVITTLIACALFLVSSVGVCLATEIVWKPINPSFGGDPLNGTYLLGKAQSQDKNVDPSTSDSSSRLDDFADSLNRSILSMLSSKIVEQAFGTDDLPSGTFKVGDFEVTITDNITVLDVTVVDVPNNTSTQISIPTY